MDTASENSLGMDDHECEFDDFLGSSGNNCGNDVKYSFFAGVGIVLILLLLVAVLLISVCCLMCRLKKVKR